MSKDDKTQTPSIKERLDEAARALGFTDTYDAHGIGEKSVALRSQRIVHIPKFPEATRLQKRILCDALRDCETVLNRFGYGLCKKAIEEVPR